MENKFIRADDVARELSVSKPYAYKLIRRLNDELDLLRLLDGSTASIFTSDFMAKERRLNKCLYSKTRATTLGM